MEKGKLPDGWEMKTLGEVCEIIGGGTPSKKREDFYNGNVLWVTVRDMKNDSIKNTEHKITSNAVKNSATNIIPKGNVIIATRVGLGKVCLLENDSAINQDLKGVIPKNQKTLSILFLFRWLTFISDKIVNAGTGATVQGVKLTFVNSLLIPLPPLSEQKEIVAILDKAFLAVDTAKANAEKNLENAKELFESYLQNVFSNGKLKVESGEWEEKTLGEATLKIGSGATPKGGKTSYKEEGISLIRSMNVHDFHFKEKKLAFIDEEQAKNLSNVTIQENDILLNITGASIARCCIVPKKYLPARVNQHVSIIRAKKEIVNPFFLASLLTSKFFKDQILEIGEQGATRQAITKIQLENFVISFPKDIKEQKQIVQKLNALSIEIKKLEAIYTQKIADLEEMKKSILQKAFRGQLNTTPSIEIKNKIPIIPNIPTTELHAGIIAIAFQIHIDKKNEKTFHHVKSEKIVHLAENFIGIHLNRNPIKDIAGPNDFQLVKKVEARARKAHFFTVSKESSIYVYKKGSQFQKLIKKTENALGEKVKPLRNLINLMAPMNTQQAEIVATIYAAWNNLIIDNKAIDDKTIVYEARENWSIEKMKIPQEKFFKAIAWMRSNNLTPNGMGKKVNSK